ncbi:hypothetical protein PIB30_055298 [Stylosanthes scabra]|uniref:Uncharacterized protein n=1 Tax=Stylosanthes scabra TaxID=79078 RepID=A0ABU6YHL6_9FABA|nr:hypothetical protein [Stylosanthes scabra]
MYTGIEVAALDDDEFVIGMDFMSRESMISTREDAMEEMEEGACDYDSLGDGLEGWAIRLYAHVVVELDLARALDLARKLEIPFLALILILPDSTVRSLSTQCSYTVNKDCSFDFAPVRSRGETGRLRRY